MRSRHFEYQDDTGKWHEDPSSDLGRIARQQDFLRRTLTAALKQNILKPKIISSLYASYRDDLVIDTGMTIDKMIEFVGVVRKVTPAENPHLPDRGDREERQRHRRADLAQGLEEHAGDPRHLPRTRTIG